MSKEAMKLALEGAANYIDALGGDSRKYRQALAEQPAQQEPANEGWKLVPIEPTEDMWKAVNKMDDEMAAGSYDGKGCSIEQAWNCLLAAAPQPAQQQGPVGEITAEDMGRPFNAIRIGTHFYKEVPPVGTKLYTSPPTLSLAQRPHECSRSHPHENMNAMCELRTEIARLTNENARLKAMHQDDEINTYRMTLLCIRDGLQQGMSKSIQKLQAREINDVLGLPSFASYRTSPPAQRTWVGLTDEQFQAIKDSLFRQEGWDGEGWDLALKEAIEAKLKEKNNG